LQICCAVEVVMVESLEFMLLQSDTDRFRRPELAELVEAGQPE
jgi:hypothetical protein